MRNWIAIISFLVSSLTTAGVFAEESFFTPDPQLGIAKGLFKNLAGNTREQTISCNNRMETASNSCLESTSPAIKEGLNVLNIIMSGVDAAKIHEGCDKAKKAMNAVKLAMTTFAATCGGMKLACQSSCSSAKNQLLQMQKTECQLETSEVACVERYNRQLVFVEKANSVCGGYSRTIGSAVVGALTAWQRSKMAQTCANETEAAATPIDCQIAANAEQVTCICQKSPRAPGCPGAVDGGTATARVAGSNNGSNGVSEGTDGNIQLTRDLVQEKGDYSGSAGSSNSPGAGTGVGISGEGGGGSSAAGASTKSADGAKGNGKGFNTNTISGDYGGGGGGRGGTGVEFAPNAYRAFLPGGNKDPSRRGTASAVPEAVGVTGSGGQDNWEKIRNRYIDTKGSLLGD